MKQSPITKSRLFNEILLVVCCGISLFILLALITFSPSDPSFNSASLKGIEGQVKNLTGRGGAYLSDILLQLIGGAAYLLPVYIVLYGAGRFKGITRSYRLLSGLASLVLVLSVAALLRLGSETVSLFGAALPAGGMIGGMLAKLLLKYFSTAGALLIAMTVLLASLMAAARFYLVTLFLNLGRKTDESAAETASVSGIPDDDEPRDVSLAPAAEPKIVEKRPAESVSRTTLDPTQEEFSFLGTPGADYHLPPSSLLDEPVKTEKKVHRDDLITRSSLLEKKLLDFGVEGRVTQVSPGPVITMYEFEPAPGVKVNKITNLSEDLALAMRAPASVRVAPLPGKAAVGIEIPNLTREGIILREIITSAAFKEGRSKLMLALGKDALGTPVCSDLARMPHLLVAGTTGSGKSVGVNSMIISLLYNATPAEVKFLMIDPKMLEFAIYDGIPHLISPVITDMKKAAEALRKVVFEMERRYKAMSEQGVRNIEGYNKIISSQRELKGSLGSSSEGIQPLEPLPYIVVIIDELADLMMTAAKDVEDSIARLAQKARASGIHLIVATQRPSVDVITGLIKANFPTRISFKVASKIDSKVILDGSGAESLLGNGDMLFLAPGSSRLNRVHGAFVSDQEVKRIVDFVKQQGQPSYQAFEEIMPVKANDGEEADDADRDEMYRRAVELITATGQASISMLQRRLKIGYPRAGRIIEMMEEDGIVGPADGSKPRDVLVRRID